MPIIPKAWEAVGAAHRGGASTVELCGAMRCEGLTPRKEQIAEARKAFGDRDGLMVMIRPRAGEFNYSQSELKVMQRHSGVRENGLTTSAAVRALVDAVGDT